MPKGVYPRTPNQLRAAKANLAKGRQPIARAKATVTLREIAADPKWRAKVSRATKTAMHQPEIRKRHLAALAHAPMNFRGGNGRPIAERAKSYLAALTWLGWQAEYPIPTKGHGTKHKPPDHYKADLANLERKIVLEMDGPSHRPHTRKAVDRRKDEVLTALGWRVIRVAY
jgi:hypothetical protein